MTRYAIVTRDGAVIGEGLYATAAWLDSYRSGTVTHRDVSFEAECVPYDDRTHEIRDGRIEPRGSAPR